VSQVRAFAPGIDRARGCNMQRSESGASGSNPPRRREQMR
jgi:hypothetical protein